MGIELDPLYTDELSGCLNRRYVREVLINELQLIKNRKRPFSIVLMDIDRLKEVNDTYGHLAGDKVIRNFAQFLRSTVRSNDYVIRFGGDEFISVMPDVHGVEAFDICLRLQQRCREKKFHKTQLTISIGISSYPEDGDDFETLFAIADEALYDAKRNGRDRIGSKRKKSLQIPLKAFVDRTTEKETLRDLILRADNKERVCVVRGNVGIGKTRLVREVLSIITCREILWADCIPFADSVSYYPIRELLRYKISRPTKDILKNMSSAYKIEIAKLIPELLKETEYSERFDDVVLDKYRLYEGIRYLICSGKTQRIIVLDNIQWIDQESIEVLKYLLRAIDKIDAIMIFIVREGSKNQQMEDLLVYIHREIHIREIRLYSFDQSDIKKIITLIIGEEPGEELVRFMAQESGGNPYYVEEMMRELFENRQLYLKDDRWSFRKPQKSLIPRSLEEIGLLRYRGLSEEAKTILDVASVIGYFDTSILQSLTGYNEGHVIGLVDDVERMGLIKEADSKRVFSDEVTRKAIYKKNVEGLKGRELHQKVGHLLEEQYQGKESSIIEQLAYHFYRAEDRRKAIDYCIRSANRAMEKFASQDAKRYYSWASEMIRGGDAGKDGILLCECLLKTGDINALIGDYEEAIMNYEEVFQLSEDRIIQARSKNGVARVYQFLGRIEESLAAVDEAEGLLTEDSYDEIAERVETLILRSWVFQMKGDTESSITQAQLALSICEGSRVDPKAKARWEMKVYDILGKNYHTKTEFQDALESFQKCLEASEKCEDKQGKSKAYASLGTVYTALSRYEDSDRLLHSALAVAEEISDIKNIGVVNRLLGTLSQVRGDFDAALEYYNKNLTISRRLGDNYEVAMANNQIGAIHLNRSDYDKADSCFQRYLTLSREMGYRQGVYEATSNLGSIYLRRGDYENAIRLYNLSLPTIEEIGNKRVIVIIKTNLATSYNYAGQYDKALELYKEVLHISETLELKSMICVISCNLGEILYSKGERKTAIKLYRRALEIAVEIEDSLTHGEILYNIAVLHLEHKELDIAESFFKEAEKMLLDVGNREKLIEVSLRLAELKSAQEMRHGDVDEHLRNAWSLVQQLDSKGGRAGYHFTYGKVQKHRGNTKDALAHLNEAVKQFEELKWRKMIGHVHFESGRVFQISDRATEAAICFQKARGIFEKLSFGNLVDQVDIEIAKLKPANSQ